MAVPFQATGHIYTVSAFFKGFHQVNGVYFAGAGHAYNFYIGRIRNPSGAGHICCGVCTIMTAKGHDFRLKVTH
jgi:hypothetical protein